MRFAPVTYSPVLKMGLYAGFCDLAINSGKPSRRLNPAVGNTLLLSTVILDRAKPFNLFTSWEFNGSILEVCDKILELLDPVEKLLLFPTVGIEKMGSIRVNIMIIHLFGSATRGELPAAPYRTPEGINAQ